jgi:hypothetical protein
LYDIRADPGEEHDIASEHKEVVGRMEAEIVNLIKNSKKQARGRADDVLLSDEDREKLRALGYVQ